MYKCICQQCTTEFSARNDSINKFCSKSCNAKYYNNLRKLSRLAKQLTNHCVECNSLIADHLKFCNSSCAAVYNNRTRHAGHSSRVTPNSKRGKNQKNRILYSKISWCQICGNLIKNTHRKTCSIDCLRQSFQKGGLRSASTQVKRSKDEIKLYDLCAAHFKSVRHNQSLIEGWDADVIIDDFKIAILWNGPWHYKQMPHKNHSLSQVQTRDTIKLAKLTSAGWNVFVFEDRYYTPTTAFQKILDAT